MILPELAVWRWASRAATICRLPQQRWCLESAVRNLATLTCLATLPLHLSQVREPHCCLTDSQVCTSGSHHPRHPRLSSSTSDYLRAGSAHPGKEPAVFVIN